MITGEARGCFICAYRLENIAGKGQIDEIGNTVGH